MLMHAMSVMGLSRVVKIMLLLQGNLFESSRANSLNIVFRNSLNGSDVS